MLASLRNLLCHNRFPTLNSYNYGFIIFTITSDIVPEKIQDTWTESTNTASYPRIQYVYVYIR